MPTASVALTQSTLQSPCIQLTLPHSRPLTGGKTRLTDMAGPAGVSWGAVALPRVPGFLFYFSLAERGKDWRYLEEAVLAGEAG